MFQSFRNEPKHHKNTHVSMVVLQRVSMALCDTIAPTQLELFLRSKHHGLGVNNVSGGVKNDVVPRDLTDRLQQLH
jgi:hypothetical protein